MKIIEYIEQTMKKQGVTAYQIEKNTGIKQQTISNWKKGIEPGAEKVLKIIKYLGVTPNEVFGYSTTPELTENEKELLELFKQLPEREQIKFIARLEDKLDENKRTEKE